MRATMGRVWCPVPGQTVPLRSYVPRILEVTSAGSRVPADMAEIRGGPNPVAGVLIREDAQTLRAETEAGPGVR